MFQIIGRKFSEPSIGDVMQIRGNVAGDLIFNGAKRFGETGTRMAKVTMNIKVKEEEAKAKFGADFHRVAFGAMSVTDGLASFPCAVLTKPNFTVEVHDVELLGDKVRVCPEVPKITLLKDEPAVILTIVLPLEVNELKKSLFGDLTCVSGDVVECNFTPIQMELPGVNDSPMYVVKSDGTLEGPKPVVVGS